MQSGNTIYEEVRTAKADIIAMERRIREIEMELKHLSGDALNDRLETYNRLMALLNVRMAILAKVRLPVC